MSGGATDPSGNTVILAFIVSMPGVESASVNVPAWVGIKYRTIAMVGSTAAGLSVPPVFQPLSPVTFQMAALLKKSIIS